MTIVKSLFILFLLLLLHYPTVFAQNSKPNKIVTQQITYQELIEKAKKELKENQIKQASKTIKQALTLAKKNTIEYADVMVIKATIEQANKEHLQPIRSINIALSIYRNLSDNKKIISTLFELSKIYREQKDYEKVVNICQQIIEIQKAEGDLEAVIETNFRLAIVYTEANDYEKAFAQYQQIIDNSTNKTSIIGRAKRAIGSLYSRRGEYDLALSVYYEALAQYQTTLDKFNVGLVQNNIGNVFTTIGDYRQAQSYYEQALDNFEQAKQKSWVGAALQNLGSIAYYQADYRQAVLYSERALKIFTEANDERKLLITYSNLSLYYSSQGDYQQAFDYYKKAETLAEKLDDKRALANAIARLGAIYLAQQEFSLALESLKRALALQQSINDRGETRVLSVQIGQCLIELKDYQNALEWASKALLEARKSGEKLDIALALTTKARALRELKKQPLALTSIEEALTLATTFEAPALEWQMLYLKALLMRDEDKLNEAIDYLQQAVDKLQDIRTRLSGGEEAENLFLNGKQQIYRDLVELLIKANQKEKAIEYIERAKQRDLSALQQRTANLFTSETEALAYQQLRKYLARIQALEQQLLNAREKRERAKLQQQLTDLTTEQQKFTDGVLRNNPRTAELLGLKAVSFASIQTSIPKDSIVLETFSLSDKLLITVFNNKKLEVKILPINDAQLQRPIQLLLASLSNKRESSLTEIKKFSQELYQLLIEPFESDILSAKELIVIVNDKLQYLPFQALWNGKQYLIEQIPVSYLATTASLIYYNEIKGSLEKGQILGYGNPFPEDNNLKLPQAELEAIGLKEIFGERALVRVGKDASKQKLLAELNKATYLHLATHAHLEPKDPKRSFIMLAGSSEQEQRLYYDEIAALASKLNGMELITLSACETALGKDGIELFGISEQFRRAGVKSVIASLWKVNDKSTKELITAFYQHLNSGQTKNQALRSAQLQLIRDSQNSYSNPYYWAPFILIGKFS